ncbi:LLM class flavin-dependent oxidoreductase [Fodinicola acaciae]|uniref:LLM class flavin-dependent oxidoreductase n=1 Tax=Fodinicola acaciae TaxID=2681555 RepID=UPI0013D0B7C8|nr:LLM class flavin-dependent oxidoreductase [Fodinicola acaciae]
MTTRPFRFAAVTRPQGDGASWQATARQIEDLGYSTLLMPEGVHWLSTVPSLAVAATAAPTLRVGSFVLAAPLRTPRSAAWDAHTMSVLTDGRFDFGIGIGRPSMKDESAVLGMPYGSAAERLEQVAQAIRDLRELDGDRRTPVMMAISGAPKSRALAAAEADAIHLAVSPLMPEKELAEVVAGIRDAAGDRADQIDVATNVYSVNSELMPEMSAFLGVDAAMLAEHNSVSYLAGEPAEMADELERRREATGISYFTVHVGAYVNFAPVIELLRRR